MEEKKEIKVRLSTVILLFIILILIGVIVFLAYKNKLLKNDELKTDKSVIPQENIDTPEINIQNQEANYDNKNTDEYEEITAELGQDEYLYVTNIEKSGTEWTLKGIIYEKYSVSKEELNNIVRAGSMEFNGERYTIHTSVENGVTEYSFLDKEGENSGIGIMEENNRYYFLVADFNFYKSTNHKKKIMLDENTGYSNMEYDETENNGPKTLKEASLNELYKNAMSQEVQQTELINNGPLYQFEFKDGKCIKATNIAYWN